MATKPNDRLLHFYAITYVITSEKNDRNGYLLVIKMVTKFFNTIR